MKHRAGSTQGQDTTRRVSISCGRTSKVFSLRAVADWARVVAWLQPRLRPGAVLALSGPLGAGKTTFVQTLAAAFGIKKPLPSPTFSLLRVYHLPKLAHGISRLVHVDAYRIDDETDLVPLDLARELSYQRTLLVLEWPEHAARWLDSQRDVIRCTISFGTSEKRDLLALPSSPPRRMSNTSASFP